MAFLISNLLSESIFDFGKWSNGKSTNKCICRFSVWPLPEVENWFQKQILNENRHISILNFFKEFRSILEREKKMDFPFYCQKVAWVGFYFWREKKFWKKPNTLVYAQVLVVTCRKLNSDKCLLRSPPPPNHNQFLLVAFFALLKIISFSICLCWHCFVWSHLLS